MRSFVVCLLLTVVSTGCVHSYKAIEYQSTDFVRAADDDGLEFSYLYDAQPGYYGSKATSRGYSVIAVRVVNTTDEPAVLDRNTLAVFYGDTPVMAARGETVARTVRQPIWNKLLWALLNITVYDSSGDVAAFIPAGPVIAGGTMLASSSNNRKMERAFTEDNLFAMTVPANSMAEGVLILSETGRAPLSFDYQPATD